jgi:hypothetical protein
VRCPTQQPCIDNLDRRAGNAARKRLKDLRAAITIMTAWRGFICNADYMFVISDVVLTQSVASRWMHRKEYPLFARGIEQGRYCGADILATLHALDGLFDYNLVYCSYAECCAIIDQAKGVPQAAERTKNQTGDENPIALARLFPDGQVLRDGVREGCCNSYSITLEKICSIFQILDCPRQFNHYYPGYLSMLRTATLLQLFGGVGATVCLPCFCGQNENGSTQHYPYVRVTWERFWMYRP